MGQRSRDYLRTIFIGPVPNTALSRTVDLLFMICDVMKAMEKPKNSDGN